MLFGLFDAILPPGKMELTINKNSFLRGEKITGHAKLTTSRLIKAKGVFARLYATRRVKTRNSYTTKTVYDFSKPLEQGAKEYSAGEYNFELTVPGSQQRREGVIGAIQEIASILSSTGVSWYVEAKLDIPGGVDVSKRIQIKVG
jgi:hypothetical protein